MLNVDDPVNHLIRSRIRHIRQSKQLSVRKAAAQCGIPESSYSCLENGFYRISLLNLNKILTGLDATIEEVWPAQQQKAGVDSDPHDLNRFRFQEAVTLSGAKSAALLRGYGFPQCVYSANLDSSEIAELAEMVEVGLTRNWTIFSKNRGDFQVHLCLFQPIVPNHLERLIDIYLEVWMADGLMKERPALRKNESADAKNFAPKGLVPAS